MQGVKIRRSGYYFWDYIKTFHCLASISEYYVLIIQMHSSELKFRFTRIYRIQQTY